MRRKTGYYQYYVEGEDEEKLIHVLKSELFMICPGKVEKFNVVQEELTALRLMQLKRDTNIVLVFDTDVGNVEILRRNIQILERCSQVKDVICIPQVDNLEDELIRSCNIKQIRELTGSKSNKDFKHELIIERNLATKLKSKDFDIKKFWTSVPANQYREIANSASEIKL
ncbi:MAG: hypothetical protein NC417_14480 [Candidatus Gastranaerophilales bacterium]|nr:hypothetical protein [Candidatus Gastranaerophilales bacterium]